MCPPMQVMILDIHDDRRVSSTSTIPTLKRWQTVYTCIFIGLVSEEIQMFLGMRKVLTIVGSALLM